MKRKVRVGSLRQYWQIRQFIEEKRLRLVDISRELGITGTMVYETARGRKNNRKVLRSFLELGVPVEYLDLPEDMQAERQEAANLLRARATGPESDKGYSKKVKDAYSTKELADLLHAEVRTINRRGPREGWQARPRQGRGGGHEWLVASMPKEEAQATIAAAVAEAAMN